MVGGPSLVGFFAVLAVLWWMTPGAAAVNGTFEVVPSWPGPAVTYGGPQSTLQVWATRIDVTLYPQTSLANVSFGLLVKQDTAGVCNIRVDMNMTYSIGGIGVPDSISFSYSGANSDCAQNTTRCGGLCTFMPVTVTGSFDLKTTLDANNNTRTLLIGHNAANLPWGYLFETLTLTCASANCGRVTLPSFADIISGDVVDSLNGLTGAVPPFDAIMGAACLLLAALLLHSYFY